MDLLLAGDHGQFDEIIPIGQAKVIIGIIDSHRITIATIKGQTLSVITVCLAEGTEVRV